MSCDPRGLTCVMDRKNPTPRSFKTLIFLKLKQSEVDVWLKRQCDCREFPCPTLQ